MVLFDLYQSIIVRLIIKSDCFLCFMQNEYRTSTSRGKKTFNLERLRVLSTKSKKKIDKKSGRKQLRPNSNDIETEIEPAPDSIFVNQTPTKVNSEPLTPSLKTKTPFKRPVNLHLSLQNLKKKKKKAHLLKCNYHKFTVKKEKKLASKFLIFNNKIIV
jgi:hypothetical protein